MRAADANCVAPRVGRFGALDLWRGVACLCVVVYHSTILHSPEPALDRLADAGATGALAMLAGWFVAVTRQLWIGVPIFFVISGYCIAGAADSARTKESGAKNYFLRRFRRIYPPYWAILVVTAAFVSVVDVLVAPRLLSTEPWPQFRPWWFTPSQWFGNVTLTETWRHHLFGSARGHFVGQSWTLCYEEQFYAVMGFLLFARRWYFAGVAAATAAVVALQYLARTFGLPVDGFFFDGCWLQFVAGTIVYYAINYATQRGQRLLAAMLAVGLATSLMPWSLASRGGAPAFAFALGLLATHRWDRAICSCRLLRPFFFCGTICYSMYLAHPPLVRAITRARYSSGAQSDAFTMLAVVPLCVAISVLAGWCCYVSVERRFLNPSQRAAGDAANAALSARDVPQLKGSHRDAHTHLAAPRLDDVASQVGDLG